MDRWRHTKEEEEIAEQDRLRGIDEEIERDRLEEDDRAYAIIEETEVKYQEEREHTEEKTDEEREESI